MIHSETAEKMGQALENSGKGATNFVLCLSGVAFVVACMFGGMIVIIDWSFKHSARSKAISWVDAPGGEIYTVKIDGHLFLTRNNQKSITHHPDCPCGKEKK